MKRLTTILFFTFFFIGMNAKSQAVLEHEFDHQIYSFKMDSKHYYQGVKGNTYTIFNSDFTVFKQVDLEHLEGYKEMLYFAFPTRHLFNSDDSFS